MFSSAVSNPCLCYKSYTLVLAGPELRRMCYVVQFTCHAKMITFEQECTRACVHAKHTSRNRMSMCVGGSSPWFLRTQLKQMNFIFLGCYEFLCQQRGVRIVTEWHAMEVEKSLARRISIIYRRAPLFLFFKTWIWGGGKRNWRRNRISRKWGEDVGGLLSMPQDRNESNPAHSISVAFLRTFWTPCERDEMSFSTIRFPRIISRHAAASCWNIVMSGS